MQKVALLMRGGVSRESGRLLDPNNVSSSESPYVNIHACADSIFENLINANPGFEFDVFVQSWNEDLEEDFNHLYSPKHSSYEKNTAYAGYLDELTLRSMENAKAAGDCRKLNFRSVIRRGLQAVRKTKHSQDDETNNYSETYAGLSSSLAVQKAIELFEHNANPSDYNRVILFRPDVILLKKIHLHTYDIENIYCNNFSDRLGDFHWVLSPKNRSFFKDLLPSISKGNHYELHKWIRNYFDQFGRSTRRGLAQGEIRRHSI
jgi:hypothetical protein